MDETFVTLAALLREAPAAPLVPRFEPAGESTSAGAGVPHAAVVRELVLMRLAAQEAFERSTAQLLRALAEDVLARELRSSPADVQALARRLLAGCAANEPVELVLSPDDAQHVSVPLPVRADPGLAPGDLVVCVREGALESHLTFRLTAALARAHDGGRP